MLTKNIVTATDRALQINCRDEQRKCTDGRHGELNSKYYIVMYAGVARSGFHFAVTTLTICSNISRSSHSRLYMLPALLNLRMPKYVHV